MALSRWMRLSLGLRMLTALFVLAVVSIPVALTAIIVGGLLVWAILFLVVGVFETVLLFVFADRGLVLTAWLIADPSPVAAVAGLVSLPVLYLRPVRAEIRAFRAELAGSGMPASECHPDVAAMARRLAQQADIPEPDVSVADRRRPESYALGGRDDGRIVVTRGLVRRLDDDQLRAVLAHEVAHLVNGDSRILSLALLPMLVAEEVGSDERPAWVSLDVGVAFAYLVHLAAWAVLQVVTAVLGWGCRFGVTTLSRGREFTADRSAAQLTGSPSALASALRKLDDERGTPSEDKRVWTRSAAALDILPHDEAAGLGGVFRTHPSTEKRIEKLERLAVAMADGE